MKKVAIVCLVCVVILLLGALLTGIGLVLTDADPGIKTPKVTETFTYSADLSELKLNTRDADINVTRGTGSEIEVVTFHDENRSFDIREENGVLHITRDDYRRKWYQFIHFGLMERSDSVSIALPEGYAGSLVLETASGDIEVSNVTLKTPLQMKTSSGDASLQGVTVEGDVEIRQSSGELLVTGSTVYGTLNAQSSSGDCLISRTECTSLMSGSSSGDCVINSVTVSEHMTVSSSSGSVRLTDSGSHADISLHATSGDVLVHNVSEATAITVKTSSGDILLRDSSCESLRLEATSGEIGLIGVQTGTVDAETSSGDIECRDFEVTGSLSFHCTSGDITCRMKNPRSDFTFYTETTTGKCNIRNDGINGSIEARARTTSGDIRFYFGE